MRTARKGDGETLPRRTTHWRWAIAAALALLGWHALRYERARLRERASRADSHRWGGEGGRVVG